MGKSRYLLMCAFAWCSVAATYKTPNFTVEAPTQEVAQQVGQHAEHYRKEKALQWLGREMPQWPQPCPLKVTLTMNGSGGATSFYFEGGRVAGQKMHIEGTLERLLNSVLPHEVTHTVFAHHFKQPVPRWADEGGSVLSEDDIERDRHDKLVRDYLNSRRAMPLRRLFSLKDYPPDVMSLYAEGYSVTNYLVSLSSRPAFLNFLGDGMRGDWDGALRTHYHINSVEELEKAWLQHLIDTKRQPEGDLTARGKGNMSATPSSLQRTATRQSIPTSQPGDEIGKPIYRGQSGDDLPYKAVPVPGQWYAVPTAAPPSVKLGPPQPMAPR